MIGKINNQVEFQDDFLASLCCAWKR